MINVKMTSPEGVTLNTGGKYCSDHIKVTPAFDFVTNAKRWNLEFETDSTVPTILVENDEWLAEHRNDPELVVAFVNKNTVLNNVSSGSWSCVLVRNTPLRIESEDGSYTSNTRKCGYYIRKTNESETTTISYIREPLNSNSTGFYGGQLWIEEGGTLCLQNGATYPIKAGSYYVIAWLE